MLVVDGVAELVEHRVHPVRVRPDVHQHSYIVRVVPPYGEAEAVLVLAISLVEVAPCQDISHLEAHVVVGPAGEHFKVFISEEAIQVGAVSV